MKKYNLNSGQKNVDIVFFQHHLTHENLTGWASPK
jgi:hypothetical protein